MTRMIAFLVTAFAILAFADPAGAQQAEKTRLIGFLSVFSQSHSGSVRGDVPIFVEIIEAGIAGGAGYAACMNVSRALPA